MKYKKIPQELISNWFMDKMQFSLNKEQLNDLCSQIDNHVKINYTRCSLQLKDEEEHDFKYWYTINRYTKIDDLTFKKGNEIISKTELYKYWRKRINPLIV